MHGFKCITIQVCFIQKVSLMYLVRSNLNACATAPVWTVGTSRGWRGTSCKETTCCIPFVNPNLPDIHAQVAAPCKAARLLFVFCMCNDVIVFASGLAGRHSIQVVLLVIKLSDI